MSVHLIDDRGGTATWVYDLTQEQYDALDDEAQDAVTEVGDDGRELTLREALMIAQAYDGSEFDNEAGQIVAAMCLLRDKLTTATRLPSVAILHEDRLEARELADDLASVLDEIESILCKGDHVELDDLLVIGQALQRWHERSWAP